MAQSVLDRAKAWRNARVELATCNLFRFALLCCHERLNRLVCRFELGRRAELDYLGSGGEDRNMSRCHVVEVAGLDDLASPVVVAHRRTTFGQYAPVRALAAVRWQAGEDRC